MSTSPSNGASDPELEKDVEALKTLLDPNSPLDTPEALGKALACQLRLAERLKLPSREMAKLAYMAQLLISCFPEVKSKELGLPARIKPLSLEGLIKKSQALCADGANGKHRK